MNAEPLPPFKLAEIEAREAAATKGPWWNDGHEIYAGAHVDIPAMSTWIGETCTVDLPDYGAANGAFIAHARQDIPALIAEVGWLAAALADEQAAHEDTIASLAAQRLMAAQVQQPDQILHRAEMVVKVMAAQNAGPAEIVRALADSELLRAVERPKQILGGAE